MLNKSNTTHYRIQRYALPCLCILLVTSLLAACHKPSAEVHFMRFDRFLFEPGHAGLDASQFNSPLINYQPGDPQFMAIVDDFVHDEAVSYIYRTTDSLYGDLGDVEQQLGKALAKAEKLCPSMHYDRFYTLVTADFDDYHNRVFCTDNELAVSLDRYALPAMQRYGCFGTPAYILALSRKEYIAPDCMAAIARQHIVMPDGQPTLLDYMVAEGKVQYFLEHTMPQTADTLRLRYSSAQLEWMKHTVGKVWAFYIENKMLYSNDYSQLRNYVDDAPKTNAFGEGSAPRTTDYIGWQIVRQYVKHSNCSMDDLFAESDSQKILTQSTWRP